MSKSYIPDGDAKRVPWFNNYAGKIGGYSSTLNIVAADVTQAVNDAADFSKMVSFVEAVKTYAHNVVVYKDHLLHGDKAHTAIGVLPVAPTAPAFSTTLEEDVLEHFTKQVTAIKANKNYTTEIGQDLGIIAAGTGTGTHSTMATARTIASAELKPTLKVKLNKGNRPYIRWHKGDTHLLRLMVDRGTGTFALLTVASHFSYIDSFALPAINTTAIWKYKAVYLDTQENEIGEWSEVAQITVTGV